MTYADMLDIERQEFVGTSAPREMDLDVSKVQAQMAKLEVEQKRPITVPSEVQEAVNTTNSSSPGATQRTYPTPEEKAEADSRSIYVGNVDYNLGAEDLAKFFEKCGPMKRVNIPVDKFSGNPKGMLTYRCPSNVNLYVFRFAYVEFEKKAGAQSALSLAGSVINGRPIRVTAKRTNVPGISTTNRMPRGPIGVFLPGMAPTGVYMPPAAYMPPADYFSGNPMHGERMYGQTLPQMHQ